MGHIVASFMDELDRETHGDVQADLNSRGLYSTDASMYQIMPYGVFVPKTAEDVQTAVALAAKHHVPILPRTAGSSLAGQAINKALIIDFTKHLNQVLELNVAEKSVRVQAGMVLDHLNDYLRPHGLQFGPDPASSNRAAMGGIVGNNSTGSHSILYGMTADHVLAMNVVLADGSTAEFAPRTTAELANDQQKKGMEGVIYRAINGLVWDPANQEAIRQGTPDHWRRCGGYNIDRLLPEHALEGVHFHPLLPRDPRFNLSKLVCGAEGTLAVMTDVTLSLVDIPTRKAVGVVHFDNRRDALDAVPKILELNPSAVEMLDRLQLQLCKETADYSRLMESFIIGDPNCILTTEFYGETETELAEKLASLETHLVGNVSGVTGVRQILDTETMNKVWKVRKGGLGLLMSIRSDFKPIAFIEDSAVPVEHLGDYVDQIEAFCEELGTEMAYYAHASAGCLHIRPLINTKLVDEVEKMPKITAFAADLLHQYGGAYSSEHGEGRARSWYAREFYGDDLYEIYRQIKQVFDPENLLNPGNIIEATPMTEHLRFGGDYKAKKVDTYLDFSADGGFAEAIEMCNGAGVCRKTSSGSMCPPFMTTRDEIDSTRGRANVLRNTLSGRLPPDQFTGEMAYRAMDLCLSCKACKSECPSSVDMAKIKAEWQAQYYKANGTPLRARIFANIEPISRIASGFFAPVVNWGSNLPLVRRLMSEQIGIGGERDLPQFAFRPFTHWRASRKAPVIAEPLGQVVLFSDTYHTYSYPKVPIAATEVLEAAGYQVQFTKNTDCGRPALSKGLIEKAQTIASQVIAELEPLADQGLSIIFLEPSELSAVTDDYASLLPQDKERIAKIAQHCLSFEQFMSQIGTSGEHRLQFAKRPREVLLHGHCHQKALIGTGPSHALLHIVPDVTVREVDSGCCGMAGSFGYETEHVAISRQIGERKLLPAVREADATTFVVAAGVSCRQQIKDGTKRNALHPAQFLRQALA